MAGDIEDTPKAALRSRAGHGASRNACTGNKGFFPFKGLAEATSECAQASTSIRICMLTECWLTSGWHRICMYFFRVYQRIGQSSLVANQWVEFICCVKVFFSNTYQGKNFESVLKLCMLCVSRQDEALFPKSLVHFLSAATMWFQFSGGSKSSLVFRLSDRKSSVHVVGLRKAFETHFHIV